jgi:hypothetical protein
MPTGRHNLQVEIISAKVYRILKLTWNILHVGVVVSLAFIVRMNFRFMLLFHFFINPQNDRMYKNAHVITSLSSLTLQTDYLSKQSWTTQIFCLHRYSCYHGDCMNFENYFLSSSHHHIAYFKATKGLHSHYLAALSQQYCVARFATV